MHIANIIAEWNLQVAYAQGTTLRGRYEREATNFKSSFEFPVHTGASAVLDRGPNSFWEEESKPARVRSKSRNAERRARALARSVAR